MRKPWFFVLLIFSLFVKSYADTESTDTLVSRHLLVKTDVLFPIGLMVEYKTRSMISFQLSGYYHTRPLWEQDYEDLQLEGSYEVNADIRHYIRNHFIGIYIKYAHFEDNSSMYAPFKQYYYAFGPLYGYQKEWGRFNLEGLIGFGISHNTKHEGYTKIGLYYFDDDDFYSPFIELRLSISVGIRIF